MLTELYDTKAKCDLVHTALLLSYVPLPCNHREKLEFMERLSLLLYAIMAYFQVQSTILMHEAFLILFHCYQARL